ncbi:MAG: prolyl oligopeptidase family serine peptidase [Rhodothermales bacterium]|nr:prolyl oligopeptidase family serine peptidase [Rhodothermales bacterium]
MYRFLLLLLIAIPAMTQSSAAQSATGFLDRSLELDGVQHRYQVFVPSDYDPERAWPVILFLHGSGERGTDGLFPTEIGLGSAIRRFSDRFPAIVVFPQVPLESNWIETAPVAMSALAHTESEFSTDPDRVYLTGLSMGGSGTWNLAYAHPERWAAVVPVCGWVRAVRDWPGVAPDSEDPYAAIAEKLADVPVWIFHGSDDRTIPVEESRQMLEALQEAGAPVSYSEFEGVGHDSWTLAYRSPDLATWLFDQVRE